MGYLFKTLTKKRNFEVTTASIHDSKIDLSEPDEVVYRDKGYCQCQLKNPKVGYKISC